MSTTGRPICTCGQGGSPMLAGSLRSLALSSLNAAWFYPGRMG